MFKKIAVIADDKIDDWVHMMLRQEGSSFEKLAHKWDDLVDFFDAWHYLLV
jgi:hypothetical protein